MYQFSSVQSLSHVWLFVIPWTAARQASLSITNSRSLLTLMSTESVMPSNELILCHPLLLLPSIFPRIRVFSNESVLHIRWPSTGVSASASVLPTNIQGWFPSELNWLVWSPCCPRDSEVFSNTTFQKDQLFGTQLSFQCSAFFTVQLSHPYMTTGKTTSLTRWTFVGKVMSLFFNILSKLVITLLPRSKPLLISWLQSQSTVILEPKKIKSLTVSTVSPSICHEVMGPDAMILVFLNVEP